jgi:uncharacterized protein YrrD
MKPRTESEPTLIDLRSAKGFNGHALRAQDGEIGRVRDLYFDDRHWEIRYFVVETGEWLEGRKILISPESVRAPQQDQEMEEGVLPVDLTRERVRQSPDIDSERTMTRQRELELREYYGWAPYWSGMFAEVGAVPPVVPELHAERAPTHTGVDPHLRSASETSGYHVAARDGEIGHVADFLVDVKIWNIRYLIVATRNWWPGRKVLLSPAWISSVEWAGRKVVTDLDRASIKASPPYDGQPLTVDYDGRLHEHYGRAR